MRHYFCTISLEVNVVNIYVTFSKCREYFVCFFERGWVLDIEPKDRLPLSYIPGSLKFFLF